MGLHSLPSNLKSVFNSVRHRGDIFKGCSISWGQQKACLLYELFETTLGLKRNSILDVTFKVASKVAAAMEGAEILGVQTNWLDRVIGET